MIVKKHSVPPQTVVNALQRLAATEPYQRAYSLWSADNKELVHVTYAELDLKARSMAANLQQVTAKNDRVMLLLPSGLEFIVAFFACLYAGTIAVPSYSFQQKRWLPQLEAMATDAQTSLLISSTTIINKLQKRLESHSILKQLTWIAIDNMPAETNQWRPIEVHPDSLALLQYTSGSTSMPKGVMISHANLWHNLEMIKHAFQIGTNDAGIFWLPMHHDMGLIGGVLTPLYTARPALFMSPIAFAEKPLRWLQAISKYRGTISGGPNFAYELCVDKISEAAKEHLDLSSWRVAFCGAETVRANTLNRFADAFAQCGFSKSALHPCYGLAEATLLVSGGVCPDGPPKIQINQSSLQNNRKVIVDSNNETSLTLVDCGKPQPNQQVIIVNPKSLKQCQINEVGEIWVAGPNVAQGYWQKPKKTAQTFQARLDGSNLGPFLRTGDMGFLHEGQLFITGRLKDIIIINGRNFFPQDIENQIGGCHPALQPNGGAAFTIEGEYSPHLIIISEIKRQFRHTDLSRVESEIQASLAKSFGLRAADIVFINTGHLPRTTSGKVRRFMCKEKYVVRELPILFTRLPPSRIRGQNETEENKDMELAHQRLRYRVETEIRIKMSEHLGLLPDQIDFQKPIQSYGLGSLQLAALLVWLDDQLDITVPIDLIEEDLTIEQFVTRVALSISDPK